jgi:predicted aldo/keto reductase-like oxidoreductase
MKSKEDLIYDLIFSDTIEYKIDISEYIEDVYKYDRFIEEIKNVLKKSKVSVVKEKVDLDTKSAIWNLKVKK